MEVIFAKATLPTEKSLFHFFTKSISPNTRREFLSNICFNNIHHPLKGVGEDKHGFGEEKESAKCLLD